MMNDEAHNEIEQMLGAYALDAVDDGERRRVESHLEGCEACRAEVDAFRSVAASFTGDIAPAPDRVWDQIASGLKTSPQELGTPPQELAPVVPLTSKPRGLSTRATGWLTAVAAAVVISLGTAVVVQSSRISDLNTQVVAQEEEIATLAAVLQTDPLQQAVTAALNNPGAQVANLTGEGVAGAMVIVVLPDGTGYVVESSLEPLPDDATYQLWAVVDDKVISAGVLGNQPDVVPFHIDPEGLQALVITQEVAGGVPQSEEAPFVAWFKA